MTDKLSKSARRRARKKLAATGEPAPAVQTVTNDVSHTPGDRFHREKPADGTRQLTISLKPHHWFVFDWLCGGLGADMQNQAATKMIRQFCIKELPRWRDAQGMSSGSVRAEDFKKPE